MGYLLPISQKVAKFAVADCTSACMGRQDAYI